MLLLIGITGFVYSIALSKNAQAKKELRDARQEKINRIDAYFTKYNMPLAGFGATFVDAAEKNGIDWRLLPAIAVKESTGGKRLIPKSYNAFGWASGSHKFQSYEHSIHFISAKLGSGKYYKNKTTEQKLKTYNPPSVEPLYAKRVMNIMAQF